MSAASGSSSRPKVNLRSTAVKRIMQEASELANPSEDDFIAAPLETDIFEWHCTMRGVAGSEYEGGLYHLRILLPPSYPMSAPDIILLTPNGRFELGKKICIDGLTSFHAGSWQPAWGVRTAVLGLRSFWMQGGEALSAIGALDYSKEERKRLAKASHEWGCPQCGKMKDQIPARSSTPVRDSRTDTDEGEVQSQSVTPPSSAGTMTTFDSTPLTATSLATDPEITQITPEGEVSETLGSPMPPPPEPRDAVAQGDAAAPTPTVAVVTPPSQRTAPIWIDGLIVAGLAVLVMLLYRKITNTSNLIETVSL